MRVKTESRRQAIISGAADVFLEAGYEATSMAKIATKTGVTKPTLYGYFPSKEDLFIEVMEKLAIELLAASFEYLDTTADIQFKLKEFGEHFLVSMLQPNLITLRGIIMTEGRRSDIGYMLYEKGLQKEIDKLANFLQAEMELGHLRPARPNTAAAHLLGLLESEYQQHLLGAAKEFPPDEKIIQSVSDAIDIFLRGYTP